VAAGDGRIDLDELDERLERTFAARTYGELAALVADLPGANAVGEEPPLVLRAARLGGINQTGRWNAPSRIIAHAQAGGIQLDFSEASCPHREVTVEAHAEYGAIVVTVPRGWNVVVEESTTVKLKNQATAPVDPSAPTIRLFAHTPYSPIKIRHPRAS
jgi:hypothetical protein